jgi:hypothetical protein
VRLVRHLALLAMTHGPMPPVRPEPGTAGAEHPTAAWPES